jgi:hypothetical protein
MHFFSVDFFALGSQSVDFCQGINPIITEFITTYLQHWHHIKMFFFVVIFREGKRYLFPSLSVENIFGNLNINKTDSKK